MAMFRLSDKAVLFAPPDSIEPEALKQIENTASLPFVFKHVAVMPDCHYGKGATIGTVLAIYVTYNSAMLPVGLLAPIAMAAVVFLVSGTLKGGVYSAHENNEVEIGALYWHFVDLIWILVFTFVYLI